MTLPSGDDIALGSPRAWQQAQRILEVLSSLNYRAGELDRYLHEIASGLSQLLGLDWSVVTLCQDGKEKVMASSLDMGEGEHIYSLHGLLTETVVRSGQTLAVEDALACQEYGQPPEGYASYLGVPLRTSQGEVIGTICSFCVLSRHFLEEEMRVAELFAERAATAINDYNLYQQQRQFNEVLEAEVAKRTEELRATQTKLIEQERLAAIGEFAATIVHEIRNPVTTIMMGLNYFKKKSVTAPDRERVALAIDEAYRLQNLLNEILHYAKPQILQLEEIELNSLIQKMLSVLREMPEAVERKIEFIPTSSGVTIMGDKDKLKQVLINLVRNGCEAIAPGEAVTCEVELSKDLRQACLQIRNDGTIIPSHILPKLTQPFCSTKSGGTGLGLAIVKRIVDAHNGIFSIKSARETGTIASIYIPLSTNNKL
ncbi:GAF domain-containing sensor histidine kinase [Aerosakkonema funiforme]|uniref:histidine kinase n=2 Tax=Oscillatoriophycideae TaxID=1301283 RepID=A0A926VJP1_9CYAN|nr:GAF domain-containing sensor histidine kinase [Aerosakkonema funiforme]MBD2184443.1 GAF domain-containing protein [Aerosakkonema funiforme FACHB-1375]